MFVLSWFPPLFFAIMNPLVEKAHKDYEEQLKNGTYNKIFPRGSNNISSVFKVVGEDFFEKGSDAADGQYEEMKAHKSVWTVRNLNTSTSSYDALQHRQPFDETLKEKDEEIAR